MNLQVEGPPLHVLVEIVEIGIVIHTFVVGSNLVVLGQEPGEGCLARSNIACYCEVHVGEVGGGKVGSALTSRNGERLG